MQRLLDAAGVTYAGCDAASSALTMDKSRTKAAAATRGVRVAEAVRFTAEDKPTADAVVANSERRVRVILVGCGFGARDVRGCWCGVVL